MFIALVSQWSGQPAHITFQILHLVFQPLVGLLVLRLALAIFGDLRAGVLALLVYEFLCSHGSFSSDYQWGGLPTELSALFFLAIIWMGLTDPSRRGTALAVLCYGSLVMAHHLSGLIATWVLGFYIAASYVGRVDGVLRVWVLRLWPLTLLVYAFYIGPYVVGHFGQLGHTDVLHFYDEDLKTGWQVATDLGPVVLVCGLGLGFWPARLWISLCGLFDFRRRVYRHYALAFYDLVGLFTGDLCGLRAGGAYCDRGSAVFAAG